MHLDTGLGYPLTQTVLNKNLPRLIMQNYPWWPIRPQDNNQFVTVCIIVRTTYPPTPKYVTWSMIEDGYLNYLESNISRTINYNTSDF